MKNIFVISITAAVFVLTGLTIRAQSNWTFVLFETTVTREDIPTSDENPTERRFYISNVVTLPGNVRSYQFSELADRYFTQSIREPLKTKGIIHRYYENDVDIDCGSSVAAKSRQDAEKKLAACIEDVKERGRVSVYSFVWNPGSESGSEAVVPVLIFRSAESPNYQPKEETVTAPKQPAANETKSTKKSKKPKKN